MRRPLQSWNNAPQQPVTRFGLVTPQACRGCMTGRPPVGQGRRGQPVLEHGRVRSAVTRCAGVSARSCAPCRRLPRGARARLRRMRCSCADPARCLTASRATANSSLPSASLIAALVDDLARHLHIARTLVVERQCRAKKTRRTPSPAGFPVTTLQEMHKLVRDCVIGESRRVQNACPPGTASVLAARVRPTVTVSLSSSGNSTHVCDHAQHFVLRAMTAEHRAAITRGGATSGSDRTRLELLHRAEAIQRSLVLSRICLVVGAEMSPRRRDLRG
jgi:hypothetical protein